MMGASEMADGERRANEKATGSSHQHQEAKCILSHVLVYSHEHTNTHTQAKRRQRASWQYGGLSVCKKKTASDLLLPLLLV